MLLVSVGLAVGLVVDVKVVADDVDDRDDLAFDIAAEARRLSLCALVRRVLTGGVLGAADPSFIFFNFNRSTDLPLASLSRKSRF